MPVVQYIAKKAKKNSYACWHELFKQWGNIVPIAWSGLDISLATSVQDANVQAMLQQSLLNITADSLELTAATASEAKATGSPKFHSTASEAVDHVPLEDHITGGGAAEAHPASSTARLEEPAQITSDTHVTAATGQHMSCQAQQLAAQGDHEQQKALRRSPGGPSSHTCLHLGFRVRHGHISLKPVGMLCTSTSDYAAQAKSANCLIVA